MSLEKIDKAFETYPQEDIESWSGRVIAVLTVIVNDGGKSLSNDKITDSLAALVGRAPASALLNSVPFIAAVANAKGSANV